MCVPAFPSFRYILAGGERGAVASGNLARIDGVVLGNCPGQSRKPTRRTPSQRATMPVWQLKVGAEENFVYILADGPSREAMVVDSGWETDPILSVIRREKLDLRFVVATHHHSDHTSTVSQLARTLGAKVVAFRNSPVKSDLPVSDGDELRLGDARAKVLHTPGHTQDSICIYDGQHLFTGDTLFIGNCGRTDLDDGSPRMMFRSLRSILKLPPETIIYPGHDYGDAPFRRLSDEARLNPTLSARSYAQFFRVP